MMSGLPTHKEDITGNIVCIVLCLLVQKFYIVADFQGAFIWSCKALVTDNLRQDSSVSQTQVSSSFFLVKQTHDISTKNCA
ncbi:hypothetical protein JHK87_018771 [Glycine soja]|nr:hypothetical protein JHK87_018771 [Glycine soja]